MSTNQQPTNNKNNDEEVDLGSLFVIIGKGFFNFFNFIGNIFKEIFHIIISTLIFLKGNSIKIGIATSIGLIAGVVLEVNKGKIYTSDLLVEPNFKSARQLYKNVNYYNDLVQQKDTIGLQNVFFLDKETAGSLKEFKIEPIINNNDIINAYNDFILEVDTATVSSFTFDEFKNSFIDLDYKIHKINVIAQKNDVFEKLDEVILSSVFKNKYFNRVKEFSDENLNRTDSLLRQNLVQLDTLRRVYMQVMLSEANRQSNGTNIDLGGSKETTNELEIFEMNRELNLELTDVVSEKFNKYDVINVVSNFPPIGYEVKGVTKNAAFQLSVLGVLLMIVILVFLKANKYLDNYKK